MNQTLKMKKLLPLVVLFVSLCFVSCKKDNNANDQITISVGGLLSLTGSWAPLGVTSQEAIHLAVKDINSQMNQTGSRYRFSTTIYDTRLDTSAAKTALKEALRNNIHYIIGPQSSAEVEAILSFANANEILVVAQSSTAGSLAVPGDALFRFCPSDAVEGTAMARTIFASGRRSVISLARNGSGNRGLQQSVDAEFRRLGGSIDSLPPYDFNTIDFSATLATLKSKIQQQGSLLGADKVGVYLASFDEAKDIFRQAANDPVLSSVHWYGGDGVVLSSVLLSDAAAASFAAAVQFFAPNLSLPEQAHPDLAEITAAIKSKTGIEPDAFALAAYDAMWVIAQTVAALPELKGAFTQTKAVFQSTANHFYGLTGPLSLNAAGDRANGSYDYWGIVNDQGTYKWKFVGKSM